MISSPWEGIGGDFLVFFVNLSLEVTPFSPMRGIIYIAGRPAEAGMLKR